MPFFTSVKFFATLTLVSAFLISLISSECTQIIVADRGTLGFDEEEYRSCGDDQFECRSGDCIERALLCDGKADCPDQSDETQAECMKPELNCPNWAFRCDYGACVHKHVMCNGVKDCLDNSDELLPECPRTGRRVRLASFLGFYDDEKYPRKTPTHRKIFIIKKIPKFQPTTTLTPLFDSRLIPSRKLKLLPSLTSLTFLNSLTSLMPSESSMLLDTLCFVPPQPVNGQWKLHQRFCKGNEDCDIPQGAALRPGNQLVYTCAADFMVQGNSNVYCGSGGNWSSIPICIVTTCSSLNSISRAATCSRFGDRVSSKSLVLPYTRARVTCRINYGPDARFAGIFEQNVECGSNGRWEPEPITCSPVCGLSTNADQERLTINGISTEINAFPWHADLWRQIATPRGIDLEFRCSATIIRTNFVITAAHCVVDETIRVSENPSRLRVTAGNTEDGSWTERKVKNVYRYCEYFGQVHGYTSDIALLELRNPFVFSTVVLPACLDVSSYSEQSFQPGTTGRIDGFGRRSSSTPNPILQTVEVTRVANSECTTPYNSVQEELGISDDEFCGVFSNETTVCDWDSGGGFVVKKKGLWHLMGIFRTVFSVGIENTRRLCGENPYSLYTKVSPYMAWIEDAMFNLERYKTYHLCSFDLIPPPLTTTATIIPTTTSLWTTTPSITSTSTTSATLEPTTTPTSVEIQTLSSTAEFSCFVPPQPLNGKWRLHQNLCTNTKCDIPDGAMLGPRSRLVYSCYPGFRVKGNSQVLCEAQDSWSAIPICVEIACDSLESVSRMVTCFRSLNVAQCNSSALPNTRAVISCRQGYRENTNSFVTGNKTVECNQNGEWQPNPVTCIPICGQTNSHLTPNMQLNGMVTDITEFPWHASLYKQMNVTQGTEELICGATIIQNNLLLTAAHCVYNDIHRVVEIAEKFSVVAGNKVRDYDSTLHDPRMIQKSMVKNVYVPCSYNGLQGNFASDVALIELREPFQLSNNLLPACLDSLNNNDQILEIGAVGKFARFGKTKSGKPNATLITTMIPYVSFKQCKMSRKNGGSVIVIEIDKFCGGNIDGMTVCHGDSGGGLIFDDGVSWNVMGILSANLEPIISTDDRICGENGYSLYTRVSNHMPWILDVMTHLERNKNYPSC